MSRILIYLSLVIFVARCAIQNDEAQAKLENTLAELVAAVENNDFDAFTAHYSGRFIAIREQDVSGEWKRAVDIWNSDDPRVAHL